MTRPVEAMSATESARLGAQSLTYSPVGATKGSAFPPGFHHLRVRSGLGRGDEAFGHAVDALFTWQMHARSGMRVTASVDRVAEGALVRCRLGPLRIPCRVVWVLDDPDAQGFGYGTLPGHPESGEEAFVVSRSGDEVSLTTSAYSRPGVLLTRLAGPLGRVGQRLMVARYAAALRTRD